MYKAVETIDLKNKKGLVIGSTEPCYESLAIAHGAEVTLVEYQKITVEYPGFATLTEKEFQKETKAFDFAISISSVEHSGLGRYGDPLDPDGDLKSMSILYNRLKVGAHLFLSVPVGEDKIEWNTHRVYGENRLPLLINGFEVLRIYGDTDNETNIYDYLNKIKNKKDSHQPVFILKKA